MKFTTWILVLASTLIAALVLPAAAEVVYTQVNVSIPIGGYYNIDLNHDGVSDFTLRSAYLQGLCQRGDEDMWSLTVNPGSGNSVMAAPGQAGSGYAAALLNNIPVNSGQNFSTNVSVMAELQWGFCGEYTMGEWLGLPARYLGLQFRASDGTIHYGWAKVSTAAYVDRYGAVHATTILWSYAYETTPGQEIMTGQTSGA